MPLDRAICEKILILSVLIHERFPQKCKAVVLCYVVGCSRMVYPVAGREEAGPQETEESTSGKYEPLVHMNMVLTEEIRKTIAEAASEYLWD